MDDFCSLHIDSKAFYDDIERFRKAGVEPETCPCDYCNVSHGNGCIMDC